MSLQRHIWEDALIDAQTAGVIPNGALLVALKLAKAIYWSPRDKRPSGLYWKNEDALEAVGCGRATYFKHKDALFDAGFFTMEKGNLIPTLPEKSTVETDEKSTVETKKSLGETEKSTVETKKSTGDNPYSVDTYSEESSSVDDPQTAVADAPSVDTTDKADALPLSSQDDSLPYPRKGVEGRVSKSGDQPESTVWTDYEALAKEEGFHFTYTKYMQVSGMTPKKAYNSAKKQNRRTR